MKLKIGRRSWGGGGGSARPPNMQILLDAQRHSFVSKVSIYYRSIIFCHEYEHDSIFHIISISTISANFCKQNSVRN